MVSFLAEQELVTGRSEVTVAKLARAEALRATVDTAVEEYGPLKPYAAQLRALTNIEVQAARRGVPSTPEPVPAAPVLAEQREANLFIDFFGGDAAALAEDLRDSTPGSPRTHALVDFFGETDARAIVEDLRR
jgi:hypothetical protein